MKKIVAILLLMFVGTLSLVFVLYIRNFRVRNLQDFSTRVTPTPEVKLKTFRSSSVMDFSIQVPSNFEIQESQGVVILTTPEGKIKIGRNATNLDNLNEYLEFHPDKPLSRMVKKNYLTIDGLDAIGGIIDNRKSYFIYADFTVFILSTDSESLYEDLDQIAQSFRYTP